VACNLYATTAQEMGNVRNVATLPLRYVTSKRLSFKTANTYEVSLSYSFVLAEGRRKVKGLCKVPHKRQALVGDAVETAQRYERTLSIVLFS
jgi:hypothetical protein